MLNGEKRLRVYNRCKYDIGVSLINGASVAIRAGSFQLLTVNDILYIESICANTKFFSSKMLVAVDDSGKDVAFEQLGLYPDDTAEPHLNDEEITAMLKQSVKKIEAWIETINDPAELDAIYLVAKSMDLPASKTKVLSTKMPDKDWLGE